MFKKSLIIAGTGVVIFAVVSCKSAGVVTDPIPLKEGPPPGIFGLVTFEDGSPAADVGISAYCKTCGGRVGNWTITEWDGSYAIKHSDFAYHKSHDFRMDWEYYDGFGWVRGSSPPFTYPGDQYEYDFVIP